MRVFLALYFPNQVKNRVVFKPLMDKILFLKIAHDRTWSMDLDVHKKIRVQSVAYSHVGDRIKLKLALKYVTNIDVANISYRQYDMV